MQARKIPYSELTRRALALGFRRADFADTRAGLALAEELTGQKMATPESATWVDTVTGMAIWVTGTPVDGVFVTLPLSDAGVAAVRDGSFVPGWPALAHLCCEGEMCAGIYIGVYAGATKAARKAVMTAAAVMRVELFAHVPCFARAATEDGRRSMESLGFRALAGGLADLYAQEALGGAQEQAA